jgi:hypothetical protein
VRTSVANNSPVCNCPSSLLDCALAILPIWDQAKRFRTGTRTKKMASSGLDSPRIVDSGSVFRSRLEVVLPGNVLIGDRKPSDGKAKIVRSPAQSSLMPTRLTFLSSPGGHLFILRDLRRSGDECLERTKSDLLILIWPFEQCYANLSAGARECPFPIEIDKHSPDDDCHHTQIMHSARK